MFVPKLFFNVCQAQNREAHRRLQLLEDKQGGDDGTSPSEMKESLLTNRRQLESLRQRLQLETSKFQVSFIRFN